MKTLKDGLYQTACDVAMPKPDRRVTREWSKAPVVTAGTQFIVRTGVMGQEMGIRDDRFWGIHAVSTSDRLYTDLIDALVPFEEETIDSVLDRTDLNSRELLDHLVEEGLITIRALDKMAQAIRAKELSERTERVRQREEQINARHA